MTFDVKSCSQFLFPWLKHHTAIKGVQVWIFVFVLCLCVFNQIETVSTSGMNVNDG